MTRRVVIRAVGGAMIVASIVALWVSVSEMSSRLRALRDAKDEPRWAYTAPIKAERFEYRGRPVRIATVDDADRPYVEFRYEDAIERLTIGGRNLPELPELERHLPWLRVLLLASARGDMRELEESLASEDSDLKLIAVARYTPEGYDPETWGAVRRRDWEYVYLEFLEEGGIARSSLTYRQLRDQPHTWQFAAAMQVTPGLHTPAARSSSPFAYPNYGPVRESLNEMGWTWPVAGVSILGLIAGVMLFAGSWVSRDRIPGKRS